MKKPKSDAQRFAQNRNTAGGTLKGIIINLEKNILPVATENEEQDINYALEFLTETLDAWSGNYKQAKKEHL